MSAPSSVHGIPNILSVGNLECSRYRKQSPPDSDGECRIISRELLIELCLHTGSLPKTQEEFPPWEQHPAAVTGQV